MEATQMKLKILLPFQILVEKAGVLRVVAETHGGSFGLLPHRLDCVAALVPGILIFETGDDESYVAVDEGVLVKKGGDVLVSVRNAVLGEDLGLLRQTVDREFLHLDEQERTVRLALAKMETAFIRRFVGTRHG